jgi:hypothetical protein
VKALASLRASARLYRWVIPLSVGLEFLEGWFEGLVKTFEHRGAHRQLTGLRGGGEILRKRRARENVVEEDTCTPARAGIGLGPRLRGPM